MAASQGMCTPTLDLLGRALNVDVSTLLADEDVEAIILMAAPAHT
jgi:hypothetical protein